MAKEEKKHPVEPKPPVDPEKHTEIDEGDWFMPAVDVYESDEAFVVVADMPGVSEESLELALQDDELILTGRVKRPPAEETAVKQEFEIGDFHRHFDVRGIDPEKVNASIKDGVLMVNLPKRARYNPIKVKIE